MNERQVHHDDDDDDDDDQKCSIEFVVFSSVSTFVQQYLYVEKECRGTREKVEEIEAERGRATGREGGRQAAR